MTKTDTKYIHLLRMLLAISIFLSNCYGNEHNIKKSRKFYNLNQRKATDSVLSSNFYILTADTDEQNEIRFSRWIPSEEDLLRSADNTFLRQTDKVTELKSRVLLDGVEDNFSDVYKVFKDHPNLKNDYIDLKRNLTPSIRADNQSTTNIVELVFVLDKELCDKFGQNKRDILDYLTIYMWDINMKFKTLQSDSVSFIVNGIVAISSTLAQPFIEEARASDGRAEFGRILDKFSKWVYLHRDSLPKFDVAPLLTNTRLENTAGGLAYSNGACMVDTKLGKNNGALVWSDEGSWSLLTVGAHQLGHCLGAPDEEDAHFLGENAKISYIMNDKMVDVQRWHFSNSSDRHISKFLQSESASCLRRIDGFDATGMDIEFASPSAPTMEEQCKRFLNDKTAWVEQRDTYNCASMRCSVQDKNNWSKVLLFEGRAVDNTLCGDGGRCFRGRCRQVGSLIKNVGSGLCLKANDPFTSSDTLEMVSCPRVGTPLDRFVITNTTTGKRLSTPFTYFKENNKGVEEDDRCVFTGNLEGEALWTDPCNPDHEFHGWDFREVGNFRFLLVHRSFGKCAKPNTRSIGSPVLMYENCNSHDVDMLWILS